MMAGPALFAAEQNCRRPRPTVAGAHAKLPEDPRYEHGRDRRVFDSRHRIVLQQTLRSTTRRCCDNCSDVRLSGLRSCRYCPRVVRGSRPETSTNNVVRELVACRIGVHRRRGTHRDTSTAIDSHGNRLRALPRAAGSDQYPGAARSNRRQDRSHPPTPR